jgi:glyoxylase-like metal-dependent hydrolase (beta-lactamase superfamily II)
MHTRTVAPSVTCLTSVAEVPTLGHLPINAFLLMDGEPMLVDTGFTPEREAFLAELGNLIDLSDLRWIWLTHADRDHTGAISDLLDAAPAATVITTFYTVGLMGCGNQPLPPERCYLVRDESDVTLGGRQLRALRPPLFDNPGTAGFFDVGSGVLFSSDFLGAALPSAEAAMAEDASDVKPDELESGQLTWGSVDSPWIHSVESPKFQRALSAINGLEPNTVLSTHLPPVRDDLEAHLRRLSTLPGVVPAELPDQATIEAAMAVMHEAGSEM